MLLPHVMPRRRNLYRFSAAASAPCDYAHATSGRRSVVSSVQLTSPALPSCPQGDFALTDFDDGCLPAAFMVGLIVASPTFAFLSRRVQPFKLMGAGLLVWTLAVAACAATWDFWSILACRMAVGVGEASFVVLAAPFIGARSFSAALRGAVRKGFADPSSVMSRLKPCKTGS